jgi:capsular exopolysaccharide synthesis family protein
MAAGERDPIIEEPVAQSLPDAQDANVFAFLNEIGVTNVESLLGFLKKRIPLIAGTVCLCSVVAVIHGLRQPDVYSAAAKVELATEAMDPTVARNQIYYDAGLPGDYLNTEIEVIKSRILASAVLTKHPELQKLLAGGDQHVDTIPRLLASISIRSLHDTRIIEIASEGEDPRACAEIANAFADTYVEFKQGERSKAAGSNVKAIAEQLPAVQAHIEKARLELANYAKEENSFDKEKDLVIERIHSYNEALNTAQRERIRADADIEAIEQTKRADRPIESAPPISSNATVQRLRADLAQAQIELDQMLERYPESSPLPKVRALKARRDDLKLELASEIETIRAGLEAQRAYKFAEEQSLEKLVGQLRDEARRLGQQAQRYVFLQKDIENNERLFDELTRRMSDLIAYERIETSNVKIVDEALQPSSPVRPNRPRTTMLGAVIGLLAGLTLAYLLERFDPRLRSAVDVRTYLGLDVLSLVPEVAGMDAPDLQRLSIDRPESSFAEAFRRLRAQLHATTQARVVLVTSGAPAEGKSTAAISLAVATAKAGARVLLIDADMRNPRVHRAFHLEVDPGLADCLDEHAQPAMKLVNETEVPNLWVLTAGKIKKNAAELLAAGGRFERVLATVKDRFDRIIVDTPPAAFLSDAAIMVPFADTVLLVVSTQHSRRRASRLALGALASMGSKASGVLLNQVSDRDLRRLYYDYYNPQQTAPGVHGSVRTS